MRWFFSKIIYMVIIAVAAAVGVYLFLSANADGSAEPFADTVMVELGDITKSLDVTGKLEAKEVTRLGFGVPGVIQQIYKTEGDFVEAKEVIASLISASVIAEYDAAYKNAEFFRQAKQEIIDGVTREERQRIDAAVTLAKAQRNSIKDTYTQLISNAKQNLLSSGLEAYPLSMQNDNVPPTVSGNYTCEAEGVYRLKIFNSSARSNISYELSGLSEGIFTANKDTPAPLGECGLFIKFDEAESYKQDTWEIAIPNTRSANYLTLKNELERLQVEERTLLEVAEKTVSLAQEDENVLLADPSETTLRQAEANYEKALADLNRIEAVISDYTIKSPFPGIVSNIAMKPGEPVTPNHTVTVINGGDYILKAQVPETDIVMVTVGQRVESIFDAAQTEMISGKVTFVSPVSTNIGGVSYYETHITLDNDPVWVREGLNADVEIISSEKTNVAKIPRRFIFIEEGTHWVLAVNDTEIIKTEVQLGLEGSNNEVEIIGVSAGTRLMLP